MVPMTAPTSVQTDPDHNLDDFDEHEFGIEAQRRRTALWTLGLGVLLVVTLILSVGIGPVSVPPQTVIDVVLSKLGLSSTQAPSAAEASIVWDIRFPRVLLGAAAGAGLAVCGAALQGVVRNVLADPYVLGISGGASTGAAASILFGLGAGFGAYALPLTAFAGALAAALLVFFIARSNGQITSIRLLLSGVAVGYALSAATSFLIFSSDSAEGSRSVMFWLLGSLALARWDAFLAVVLISVLLSIGVLLLWSRRLDALTIGDETAYTLGIAPSRARIQLLAIVSLCTGAVVAAVGSIGFVGLVVPHLGRRIVGSTHARLIPISALIGAILLVWADTLARIVMQPRELPIGVITAMLGAPLLLVLIRRLYARQP